MTDPSRFQPRPLSADYAVAPQLSVADVAAAAAQGYRLIVNNRPDGEEPGAPQGADIAAAAAAHGLAYVAVPVGGAGIAAPQLDALADALAAADGPVLAYCRSGTRSTTLWALTRARAGDDPDALLAAARGQGYDLAHLAPMLASLAAGAR